MHSNGTLPLDTPLDARCGYALKGETHYIFTDAPMIIPSIDYVSMYCAFLSVSVILGSFAKRIGCAIW